MPKSKGLKLFAKRFKRHLRKPYCTLLPIRYKMPQSRNDGVVYEPAEDTYLLLRAAMAEARGSDRVLEVGCGSGLISRNLAPRVREVLATDINPFAVSMLSEYGIPVIRADLFRGIKAKFDLVIFNPPYLPTSEEEKTEGWMNFALDGGESGRETIKRFFEDLELHLTTGGRALILLSSLTGIAEVKKMACELGFDVSEVAIEKHFFEQLYILKLQSRQL
jgi:release factor glutamine methyltransferase